MTFADCIRRIGPILSLITSVSRDPAGKPSGVFYAANSATLKGNEQYRLAASFQIQMIVAPKARSQGTVISSSSADSLYACLNARHCVPR